MPARAEGRLEGRQLGVEPDEDGDLAGRDALGEQLADPIDHEGELGLRRPGRRIVGSGPAGRVATSRLRPPADASRRFARPRTCGLER